MSKMKSLRSSDLRTSHQPCYYLVSVSVLPVFGEWRWHVLQKNSQIKIAAEAESYSHVGFLLAIDLVAVLIDGIS